MLAIVRAGDSIRRAAWSAMAQGMVPPDRALWL